MKIDRQFVEGMVMAAIGFVIVFIGLIPEMTCSLIGAFGGRCIVILGRLAVEESYNFAPALILLVGAVFIVMGLVLAFAGIRED